ncbi:MAG: D-beta-D-heptose 7-phosphate kinase [Bacteroidetes bacterium ADurb.Bin141]|nr:D-glycero-beta-D-manno-heptose-7-phosphate kinase [Bacteroidia bacterium]OQB62437.1 MAG: D-beta-D-heptose 7-phosphate kinase [Bacteroidetes bacterium ADurb.Bin141]
MRALVIGDVMVDAYLWGKVDRISPEAPVPVVAVEKRESRPGGAANVAVNIYSLGAVPYICSVIGKDSAGAEFKKLITDGGMSDDGIITSTKRTTTIKTRVIGNNHQLMRVDSEVVNPLSQTDSNLLIKKAAQLIRSKKPSVVIFEDYDKGVLNKTVIEAIVAEADKHGIPTTVDPKKNNFFHYRNVTLFKPNLKELREGLKTDLENPSEKALTKVASDFASKQKIKSLLITLSEKGVYYFSKKDAGIIPAHLRNISDVSGAGDTVISVASLALASGMSLKEIAAISNLAGGLVCEKVGVVPIERKLLLDEVKRLSAK